MLRINLRTTSSSVFEFILCIILTILIKECIAIEGNCVAGGSGYGYSFDWTRADTIGLHWKNIPTMKMTNEMWYINTDLNSDNFVLTAYSAYNVNGNYGQGGDAYESANELMVSYAQGSISLWWGGEEFYFDFGVDWSEWTHYAFTVDTEIGEHAFYINGDMIDTGSKSVEFQVLEETEKLVFNTMDYGIPWDERDNPLSVPYLGRHIKTIQYVKGSCTTNSFTQSEQHDTFHNNVALFRKVTGCSQYDQLKILAEKGYWAIIVIGTTDTGKLTETQTPLSCPILSVSEEQATQMKNATSITFTRTKQLYMDQSSRLRQKLEPAGILHFGLEADRPWAGFDERQSSNGVVDEFRVWKTVRSPEEIKRNYRRSIGVNSTESKDLNLYWKFDQTMLINEYIFTPDSSDMENHGLVGRIPTIENEIHFQTDRKKSSPSAPRHIPTTQCPLVGDGEVIVPIAPDSETVIELKSFDPDGDDLITQIRSLPTLGSLHLIDDTSDSSSITAKDEKLNIGDQVIDLRRTDSKRIIYKAPLNFETELTFQYSVNDGGGFIVATVRLVKNVIQISNKKLLNIEEDTMTFAALASPSLLSQKNMQVMITSIPSKGKLFQAQFNPKLKPSYKSLASSIDQYGPMTPITSNNTFLLNERGIVLYQPENNQFSVGVYARFGYKLVDQWANGLESEEAWQEISVSPVNDAPQAMNMNLTAKLGAYHLVQLEGVDVDSHSADSFAKRLYGKITQFPKGGSLYQFDATKNHSRGELIDSTINFIPQMYSYATKIVRYSSQYSVCGKPCHYWNNPLCTSNDLTSGGNKNGTCAEDSWVAGQILNEPDVYPEYADHKRSWNLGLENFGHEWIELEFPFKMYINSFELYENFKPGALFRFSTTNSYIDDNARPCAVYPETGLPECTELTQWQTLWERPWFSLEIQPEKSVIFRPNICPSLISTNIIRLDLNTSAVPGWNSYDAIKVAGSTQSPAGLLHDSLNRFVFLPLDGVHGKSELSFTMSDCINEGQEGEVYITVEAPTQKSFSDTHFFIMNITLETDLNKVVRYVVSLDEVVGKIETILGEARSLNGTVWYSNALGINIGDEYKYIMPTSTNINMTVGTNNRIAGSQVELWISNPDSLTFRVLLDFKIYIHCVNGRVVDGFCLCLSERWEGESCDVEMAVITNSLSVTVKILAYAEFSIIITICIFVTGLIFVHKSSRQVASLQPIFLFLIIFGCFISSGTIVSLVQEGSNIACISVPWFYCIGLSIVMGSLLAKFLRVNTVIRNGTRFRRKKTNPYTYLWIIVAILAIFTSILTVWTVKHPLKWITKTIRQDPYGHVLETVSRCESSESTIFTSALGAAIALTLIITLIMSFKGRNISSSFSESSYLILAIGSSFELFLIAIPVLLIVNDQPTLTIFVQSSVVFLNTLVIMGFIFGNLFRQIYFIKVDKPSLLKTTWTRNKPSKNSSNEQYKQRQTVQIIAENILEKEQYKRNYASENDAGDRLHSNGNMSNRLSYEGRVSTIAESENQLNESDFMSDKGQV